MKDVTVHKNELLDTLGRNRREHRAQFEAALEGYKERCLALLEDKLAELRAGRTPLLQFGLPVPQDHTPDYDRIIRMVEMEVGETITLDQASFAQYVMDDWTWKREFAATSSFYLE